MNYIDSHVLANEKIVYRTRLHWIVFAWPILWILIVLYFSAHNTDLPETKQIALGALAFGAWIWCSSIIRYLTSEFGVTDQRVILKVGFIRIISVEILLEKIESIKVDQSVMGRILGYGSVIVTGVGGSSDPFHGIDHPLLFRKKVQEQIEAIKIKP